MPEMKQWRVGTKVPVNIYKGDVIAAQAQTPELAAELVSAANNGIAADTLLQLHKVPPTPARLREMADHLGFAADVGSERHLKARVAMMAELRALADAMEGKRATEP